MPTHTVFWTAARKEALATIALANPTWRVPQIGRMLRRRGWRVTDEAVAQAIKRMGLRTPRGRIPKA